MVKQVYGPASKPTIMPPAVPVDRVPAGETLDRGAGPSGTCKEKLMTRPDNRSLLGRRYFIAGMAGSTLLPFAGAAAAAAPAATPPQTLGPFYPRNASERPAKTGPDLIRVDGDRVLTRGSPVYLTGRVLDLKGAPEIHARVEIWQCDANAVYHHPAGGAVAERDPHFQGYGVTEVDESGTFHFRTIMPVAYPGRTPHIHVRVESMQHRPFATQWYLPGDPGNRRDFLFSRLTPREQAALTLQLLPGGAAHPLARATHQTAQADIVLA
jgi:protocatechuate 3,4-dioxygenase, beta subunit